MAYCDKCKKTFKSGVSANKADGNTLDICSDCCFLVEDMKNHPLSAAGRPPTLAAALLEKERSLRQAWQDNAQLRSEIATLRAQLEETKKTK